jgi:hypothetical protein
LTFTSILGSAAQQIRAYARAGFKEIDRRMTISGEAVLMGRNAVPFGPLAIR